MAEFQPINTQEELDAIISKRLTREREATDKRLADYDAAKEKARLYEELMAKKPEETIANLTEELKAAKAERSTIDTQMSELRQAAETAKRTAAQLRAASEYGLPVQLADRLHGETDEELRQDAESLAGLFPRHLPPLKSTEPKAVDTRTASLQQVAEQLFERRG